jgi:O-methyltransferase
MDGWKAPAGSVTSMLDGLQERRTVEERYLDLLKQCLTGYLTIDHEVTEVLVSRTSWDPKRLRHRLWAPFRKALASRGVLVVRTGGDRNARAGGGDWPPHAETMVGLKRLDNLQHCILTAVPDGVPGDLMETGVWRGGASIFMRAVLEVAEDTERRVWVADSFQGLPPPDVESYPRDAALDLSGYDALAVSLNEVKANFARYGLLDERVCFLPGWFRDTLPAAPIDRLAVLRLDGDYYESTIVALEALYPKVAIGGFVIVDDYHAIRACREAVDEYRQRFEIVDPITDIDEAAVYWRRSG